MTQIGDFIKRIAARTGYKREFYQEQNMPTTPSNVVVIPWYGDIESTFIFSSLLLKPYMERNSDKYFILCSWPGFHDLFPYVDEFWCLEDESSSKTLAADANNFYNNALLSTNIGRTLIENVNTQTSKDFLNYYNRGFTKEYWQLFGKIHRFLPQVPSEAKLSTVFKNEMQRPGRKVFVFPAIKMRVRDKGKTQYMTVPKQFWDALFERLLSEGITPVVYQNWFTYDMSRDFVNRCIYVVPRNVSDVLAAMKNVGLVLDVHSGISRLAIAARTPFIFVDERARFMEQRGFEVDDLCCVTPRRYIFSFSTMLMTGSPEDWKDSIIDNIIVGLKNFNPSAGDWGSDEIYEEVSYDAVRKHAAKQLGLSFIKKK